MIHRFDDFELDAGVFELRRAGAVVPLQRRAFDLLRYLVEHTDVVVTKAELLEHVWSDVVVSKDALPQAMMAVRSALGDDVDAPRFVHTIRGRGYRFVARVERGAADRTKSPGAAAPAASPLVGRAAVVSRLRERLAAAVRLQGSVVLVTGAAGLGKTRLASELAHEAREAAPVLVRCWSASEGAPPLWPLSQVFRELDARGVALPEAALALARSNAPSERLEVPEARFRVLEGASSALVAAAVARPPLVVVLDDLHLADVRTVEALQRLARGIAGAPLLVVATYAPRAGPPAATLSALASLARDPGVTSLPLEPLARGEVAELLASLVGDAVSPNVLDKVMEKTGGSPMFVARLAHVLRAGGDLRGDAPATSALVGGEDMHAAILHHLGTLPARVARTLTVAAVFGGEFAVAPLASVLHATNAEVLADLQAAELAKVVARAGVGRHRFTYPVVPDVLRRALTAAERAELHGLAARALEAQLDEAETDHLRVGEVARHLVEAAPAGDAERAATWSIRAAELAAKAGDARAAATYARRGLEALACAARPPAAHRARLTAFVQAAGA